MPRRRGWGGWALFLLVLALAAALGWRWLQAEIEANPQRFPFTELDLGDPIGPFTGRKLARLGEEPALCLALLARVGDADRPAPKLRPANAACGYADGVTLRPEDGALAWRPAGLVTACPVAAALRLWEREVLQPAAQRHFGTRVTGIDHFGSYSCRRLYNRPEAGWSEHATANAVDIAGFRLGNGESVSVLADWSGTGAKAAFLRDLRDGACPLFASVLSPEYNAAHRDHLHFDQAARGALGWRICS